MTDSGADLAKLSIHTCPNCGGEMLGTTSDEYCTGCYHEGRV